MPTDPTADQLLAAAVTAGDVWAQNTPGEREAVLHAVADALDAAVEELVPIARRETHLPEARLRGELQRTTFQLRLLARAAAGGEHLNVRIDHADPAWPMGVPRPDLRRSCVPLGPVLVFAASNFPFAFSVAGGDTAAALAVGCPVIVKAHEGHPELSDATAAVVTGALQEAKAPDGLFAVVHAPATARDVLTHPALKAAAFTGSIPAGRALFDLAQSRPEPIPFFGELGSVNPAFVTAAAIAARGREIAEGFVGSFTLGAGQFCTKPGLVAVPADSGFVDLLREVALPQPAPLLNDRIAAGFEHSLGALRGLPGVAVLTSGAGGADAAPAPLLLTVSAEALLKDADSYVSECFGPAALVVTYRDEQEMLDIARSVSGQLTATLVAEPDDAIVPVLARVLIGKAGRLLWNQWPTGVSVTYAQHHGGPYPASTAPATTSVGTGALARFVRPVAWQGFPQHLLPAELRDPSESWRSQS